MPNTYKTIRVQPLVRSMDVGGQLKDNVVDSLIVGVTTSAEDGYTEYIEATVRLPAPDPSNFVEFADIDEAWSTVIADRHIAENNWHEALDKKIETKRLQPLPRPFAWQPQEPASG